MTKAPDAFRTISEVAEELDLPQHVLRFWETRFSQIKPMKRGGGRRYYRPDDVSLLRGVKYLLYSEGYTIKGVQRILKELGIRAVQMEEGQEAPSLAEDGEVEATVSNESVKPVEPIPDVAKQESTSIKKQENSQQKTSPKKVVAKEVTKETPSISPLTAPEEESVVDDKTSSHEISTPIKLASGFQIPEDLISVKGPEKQEEIAVKTPPFALTHAVPDHLVDAITAKNSLVEIIDLPDQDADTENTALLTTPSDILLEEDKEEPVKKKAKGIFSRFANEPSEDEMISSSDMKIDDKGAARLQETLVDLLECKRLLDQIR